MQPAMASTLVSDHTDPAPASKMCNVAVHKKHIADAVETQQQRRKWRGDPARDQELGSRPLVNWKYNQCGVIDRQPEQRVTASYSVPQSREGRRSSHDYRQDAYTPLKMFSSKPPSRHGFRPLPGNGQFL